MSELFKQVSYHELYCDGCAKKTTADLVAFDFTRVFSEAIKENNNQEWDFLMRLNLKFYYSLRDLYQEFDYQLKPDRYTPLTLCVKHVRKQIEFLMQVPLERLYEESEDSNLYNELYRQLELNPGTPEETMEDILKLLHALNVDEDLPIVSVDMEAVFKEDDHQLPLPIKINYQINGKISALKQRICPHCGSEYHHNAGYHKEYIIGLAGLPRVGKTAYIVSLVHLLSQTSHPELISIDKSQYLDERFEVFKKEMIEPYRKGQIIKKTGVEDIPLVYLTLNISNQTYNFMFVDMPGEVFDNKEENGINYVLNKRSILTKADMVWCCINPEQINSNYKNTNEGTVNNNDIGQLSNLTSTLEMLFNHRQIAAIIITQCDLLDGKYALFRPNVDVLGNYVSTDGVFNLSEAERFINETKRFVQEMKSFEITMDELFKGYSLFGVASYGFDVLKQQGSKEMMPSMVELPFLWTLAVLGLIPTKKTISKKSLFGEKEKQEFVEDINEMFIR